MTLRMIENDPGWSRMLSKCSRKPYESQRSDKLSSIVARIGGNLVECVVYTCLLYTSDAADE